jgi:hypothetical protein
MEQFDSIFELPRAVTDDPKLRAMYELIVQTMREEARHVPMNMVQILLIERIASNYVYLRSKEDADGFNHATQQKDFNTFWLSMTSQFNRILERHALNEVMGHRINSVFQNATAAEPKDVRDRVRSRFAAGLEAEGL